VNNCHNNIELDVKEMALMFARSENNLLNI